MSVPIRVQMDFIDFNYSPSSNWNTRFTPFTPGYSPSLILSFFLFYCSKMWHVERQLCLVDNLVVAQLCLMLYDRVRVGWAKYRWPSTQTSNGISKKCVLNGLKNFDYCQDQRCHKNSDGFSIFPAFWTNQIGWHAEAIYPSEKKMMTLYH